MHFDNMLVVVSQFSDIFSKGVTSWYKYYIQYINIFYILVRERSEKQRRMIFIYVVVKWVPLQYK